MGSDNRYDGLDADAIKLARTKARLLVGHAGFVAADLHDIEQELVSDLLRRMPLFDPKRASWITFVSRVLEHQVADMVAAQKAGIRDYRNVAGSLDERNPGDTGAGDDRPRVLDEQGYQRRHLAAARRDEELGDLRRDLERFLFDLPADLRELCLRLRESTVSEVARETGVPRGTLYDAMARVRVLAAAAGLADYLGGPTHPGARR